ncbi:HNH endonuclease, partial [Paenibacillus alvei]|nr:HNH endonuclease [Paenibacillus alvei]
MKEYKTIEQKRKFYDSQDWKQMREEVKKRDNFECQECKRNGYVSI